MTLEIINNIINWQANTNIITTIITTTNISIINSNHFAVITIFILITILFLLLLLTVWLSEESFYLGWNY